jgi:hypothetical protein
LAASPSFQSYGGAGCVLPGALLAAHSSNDAACRLRVMSVRRLRRSTCVTRTRKGGIDAVEEERDAVITTLCLCK